MYRDSGAWRHITMSIRKATLFAGSMLFTLAASGYAAAQTSNPPNPTVVVTGTRIPRPNLDQPVPVGVVSQQVIENSPAVDLGQIIQTLPSMGAQGSQRALSFGINLDLQGLSF